jgi:hypothetical protein
MSNPKRHKRNAQQAHFKKRAYERLGYELTNKEVTAIRHQVRDKTAILLSRPSFKLSIWRVSIKARPMIVVFDAETEELVTMLNYTTWQEQRMSNAPDVPSEELKDTLASHPGAAVLRELRDRLEK